MLAAIKKCYYEGGLVGIAKMPETYERATILLPEDITEVFVPDGIEPEEDVGQLIHDPPADDDNTPFDIEIDRTFNDGKKDDNDDSSSSDEGTDSEKEAKRGRGKRESNQFPKNIDKLMFL